MPKHTRRQWSSRQNRKAIAHRIKAGDPTSHAQVLTGPVQPRAAEDAAQHDEMLDGLVNSVRIAEVTFQRGELARVIVHDAIVQVPA